MEERVPGRRSEPDSDSDSDAEADVGLRGRRRTGRRRAEPGRRRRWCRRRRRFGFGGARLGRRLRTAWGSRDAAMSGLREPPAAGGGQHADDRDRGGAPQPRAVPASLHSGAGPPAAATGRVAASRWAASPRGGRSQTVWLARRSRRREAAAGPFGLVERAAPEQAGQHDERQQADGTNGSPENSHRAAEYSLRSGQPHAHAASTQSEPRSDASRIRRAQPLRQTSPGSEATLQGSSRGAGICPRCPCANRTGRWRTGLEPATTGTTTRSSTN